MTSELDEPIWAVVDEKGNIFLRDVTHDEAFDYVSKQDSHNLTVTTSEASIRVGQEVV